jgi:Family of unknown function (DUF5683)
MFLVLCTGSIKAQLQRNLYSTRTSHFTPAFHYSGLPADSTVKAKVHSPKKAATMSALCPGLGQIYNRKYWKLPIIYVAMGGCVFGFAYNQNEFAYYRDVLRVRYDDDSLTVDPLPQYSDASIVALKNDYQRYRDLCVIGFSAIYLLQVIDAAVDAHLYTFDVGPDLSLQWSPRVTPGFRQNYYGIGLRLTAK